MLSPETHNFSYPDVSLHSSVYDISSCNQRLEKQILKHSEFNRKIILQIPDVKNSLKSLTKYFSKNTLAYSIKNLPLYEFLNSEFVQIFLSNGQLTAFSSDSKFNLNESFTITADGILHLLVTKDTYAELGINGNIAKQILKSPNPNYVIQINLKQECPAKKFNGVGYKNLEWDVVELLWTPEDKNVCPSSIAKYFVDKGYEVNERNVQCSANVLQNIKLLKFDDIEHLTSDHLDWLGFYAQNDIADRKISSTIQIVPEHEATQTSALHNSIYEGIFPSHAILAIIQNLRDLLEREPEETVPWCAMTVYGASNCFAGNNYWQVDGENYYTLIIKRTKLAFLHFEASHKPQRYYLKTSNK